MSGRLSLSNDPCISCRPQLSILLRYASGTLGPSYTRSSGWYAPCFVVHFVFHRDSAAVLITQCVAVREPSCLLSRSVRKSASTACLPTGRQAAVEQDTESGGRRARQKREGGGGALRASERQPASHLCDSAAFQFAMARTRYFVPPFLHSSIPPFLHSTVPLFPHDTMDVSHTATRESAHSIIIPRPNPYGSSPFDSLPFFPLLFCLRVLTVQATPTGRLAGLQPGRKAQRSVRGRKHVHCVTALAHTDCFQDEIATGEAKPSDESTSGGRADRGIPGPRGISSRECTRASGREREREREEASNRFMRALRKFRILELFAYILVSLAG
ncbi:uncharacterized protein LOC112495343 [Cephus cinctus]|uniref:Uncharacterized protein LOC112495343 n=1 Tax=Cephus cinctus TaxID=211228 RepID=A0AAJ7W7I1_CEPCN|nr:uncharacterized protein LOC112495343 [Cephus cinctus]